MTTRLEWTGYVEGNHLRASDGSEAPTPDAMLWLFSGRQIRIVIEDLGAVEVAAEPFALCAKSMPVAT
jgi:hypothetical protein